MRKIRNKRLAFLLVLTMLATLFVGVGTASARSVNSVDKVLSVGSTYDSTTAGTLGVNITIQENKDYLDDFTDSSIFELELPAGVEWVSAATTVSVKTGVAAAAAIANTPASGYLNFRTDQVLEIVLPNTGLTGNGVLDVITVNPGIKIDGFAGGDVAVKINSLDSPMTSGSVVFATVGSGSASVSVSSVAKVAKGSNQTGGTIAIRENSIGAIGAGRASLTLKLPANYEWNSTFGTVAGDITFAGGLAGATPGWAAIPGPPALPAVAVSVSGRTATIPFDSVASATRGTIYIAPRFNVLGEAAKGEIQVNVSGTKANGSDICDGDIVVAEYVDWGTTSSVSEVKDLRAGKFGVKTADIKIKENMVGSLVNNRTLTITLPDWVKVTGFDSWTAPTGSLAGSTRVVPDGKKSYAEIDIRNAAVTKGELKFKLELSIQADKSGDIEAIITGAGVTEEKLVIAKAVQPASIETSVKDLKVGIQSQELNDIVITEGKKEAAALQTYTTGALNSNGKITVTLTEGVKFATTPKVEITEGDMEVKDVAVDGGLLTMAVKSESTKASKITISGVKVTLDRTVPEGPIYAKLGGTAINENQKASLGFVGGVANNPAGNAATVDQGEFDVATVQKVQIGNVVTAAPGEITNEATFVIGAASYKLNGVDQTMDVAPYIKDSRTYMPIRYVAYALGINDANILWDGVNQTVTLMKGDKVVQLKIGSKNIMINGAIVAMDVAPEISNSRTMLPISFVANAFGATASWDAATQTVTIK